MGISHKVAMLCSTYCPASKQINCDSKYSVLFPKTSMVTIDNRKTNVDGDYMCDRKMVIGMLPSRHKLHYNIVRYVSANTRRHGYSRNECCMFNDQIDLDIMQSYQMSHCGHNNQSPPSEQQLLKCVHGHYKKD